MGDDALLVELGRKILADLARSSLTGALPTQMETKPLRGRIPKHALPPSDEDMDARLEGIRRYITPRELAGLLHWHLETVYRKAKKGMPVDRELDQDGRGRLLKIYPPQIAEWRRQCREARKRLMQSSQVSPTTARANEKKVKK